MRSGSLQHDHSDLPQTHALAFGEPREDRQPPRLQMSETADTVWWGLARPVSRGSRSAEPQVRTSILNLTDEELVRRACQRDAAAFAAIVARYQDRVYWLARRMVGGADAEDITQEVFLRAYRAMPGLRASATLGSWLTRIAHNLCLTELGRRSRRGEHIPLDDQPEAVLEPIAAEAADQLARRAEERDFAERLLALVDRLPAEYRTVLTLYYVNEAKYEEIAEITGYPLGTVKTYLHRAKLRLRQLVLADLAAGPRPPSEGATP